MRKVHDALTFDDVLLLPAQSAVLPKDACLKTKLTREIDLNIPLISAAMDTVTESSMAIAMAEEGGIGVIHKNMSAEAQAAQVKKVKKFESGIITDPVTVTADMTLGEVIQITQETNFAALPVVEGKGLCGIITSRDMRFAKDLAQPVSKLMTPKSRLVTVKESADREDVIDLLREHRIEKVLVVNDAFELRGMITVKDILKSEKKPNSCRDADGRLRVAAAVGTGVGTEARISGLVAAGVDVLVVDTAHGHSQGVLDRICWVKKTFPDVQVIGGNVATGEAALALISVGVDGIKVGIGPGSICTTRIVTGVGVPQLSAILNVCEAVKKKGVPIIADGGVRFSGDLCKAIAAGASVVMVGGLLAGTEEAPGEIELYQGRSYKSYRGMGSLGAMAGTHGSSDRYFQDANDELRKLVPEGIEGRVPYKGKMLNVVYQLMGGLRSSMGYTGCQDLLQMRSKPEFVKISQAGMNESHVHDVRITKEAPNYQIDDRS